MLQKYGFLAAMAALVALAALVWIGPQTVAGQTALVGIVAGLVVGVGGLVWRRDA